MKTRQRKATTPQALKRKLVSALCMLLISALLMTGTTYAWLVLSTAPEVSGITTNVGANGALEIALLTTETREDLSQIRTSINGSLANQRVASTNTTWGNLIDLTVADYGLDELVLLPARLQYSKQGDGSYRINAGLLSVPVYGYDGRIAELTNNTVSAIYGNNKEFSYAVGVQDYGVRAIGTSDTVSVQASALATAKGNITSYTKQANSTAANTLSKNGPDLFSMILAYSTNSNTTFDDADVAVIEAMIADLETSVSYIDLALRYGLVAVAASEIDDKTLFGEVQNRIMDTEEPLSKIYDELTEFSADSLPTSYREWIRKAENAKGNLTAAKNECDALTDGSYTWDELKPALNYIMNMEQVYINDTPFSDFDSNMAGELLNTGAKLTLPSGSGVFADVADFAGDYETAFSAGVSVEIETLTTAGTPYLTVLSNEIRTLEAAGGGDNGVQIAELTATYGYALDMAFRCNATGTSNLLLQTAAVQRIYSDSTAASTMGGGSYMEFSTKDATYSLDQMLALMDAVRVAFVDDQGTLLKVAKLNTSNRKVENGVVKAPLYVYDFSFSEEDGAMIMGERQKTNNVITSLTQNQAKALTVVVWLDGDLVDNTMVSATEETSLNGVLNLQFATDADLVPAGNTALKNATTDKTALTAAVEAAKETYDQGQGTYTTISWDAFVDAYTYADTITYSASATEAQVYNASGKLAEAIAQLTPVTHDALSGKILELRDMMGRTENVAAYVVHDEANDAYVAVGAPTEEQMGNAKGTIYRVDYKYNLNDEGGDVFTPIYTDDSWSALAAALYAAEATHLYDKATDAQIDAAITALETAKNNLEHCVFYVPYEYEDVVYYYAIPRTGEATEDVDDTYGRWYDDQFQRITSDLTILTLDARAQAAQVASIEQNTYISNGTTTIAPSVTIFEELYPALRGEEILAVQWDIPENLFTRSITSYQIAALTVLKAEAEALNADGVIENEINVALIAEVSAALAATGDDKPTEAEAADLIARVEEAIKAVSPEKEAPEAIPNDSTPMTDNQRILLTTAVNAAKAVTGYDNAAKTELNNLRTATSAVEALLALETGATSADANTKLDALNAELVALGKKEVNAYNTLQYTIPVGSELKETVYGVDIAYVTLTSTGELGTGTISAIVLTKSGIVFTAAVDVEVYEPAEGVQIVENGNTLSAELTSRVVDGAEVPTTETIAKYTWASSNTDILTVNTGKDGTCTVTAVADGTANVTLSVTTVQGNVYTAEISITVTAAP